MELVGPDLSQLAQKLSFHDILFIECPPLRPAGKAALTSFNLTSSLARRANNGYMSEWMNDDAVFEHEARALTCLQNTVQQLYRTERR